MNNDIQMPIKHLYLQLAAVCMVLSFITFNMLALAKNMESTMLFFVGLSVISTTFFSVGFYKNQQYYLNHRQY